MNLDAIKDSLPDYAKDIRLNLSNVMSEEGSIGLEKRQIYGTALASAYACQYQPLIQAVLKDSEGILSEADLTGVQGATAIMAMNNIYYRFTHLVEDTAFRTMPPRLRMNVMANPGVSKIDFELYSLAVSAINGCGRCLDSHTEGLKKEGVTAEAIQSAIRIASVVHACAQVMLMSQA